MAKSRNVAGVNDETCRHVRKGRYFPAKVRRALEAESRRLRGDVQCLCCGDWQSVLHLHHIMPWSEKGTSEVDNGAILCPRCHGFADRAIIPPQYLRDAKLGLVFPPFFARGMAVDIEEAIASVPTIKGRDHMPVNEVVRTSLERLGQLTCCETKSPAVRNEWRHAVGRVQLLLAGALTSKGGVEDVPQHQQNRYIITMLSRNAASLGRQLKDWPLLLESLHMLAVNANALHRIGISIKYCDQIRKLLSDTNEPEVEYPEYVAFTLRNISVIYAKAGVDTMPGQLLDDSERLAPRVPETVVRTAEVLMLGGEFARAYEQLEPHASMSAETDSPIRQVIAERMYGMHACLSGNPIKGLEHLDRARRAAAANSLGHQEHKIAFAHRALSSKQAQRLIGRLGHGKSRQRLPPSLLRLF